MQVELQGIGKRYHSQWVIKDLYHTFSEGNIHALIGQNGSGKSTVLRIIGSSLIPSEGSVTYASNGEEVAIEDVATLVNFAAPYAQLVNQMSVEEYVAFYSNFRTLNEGEDFDSFYEKCDLVEHKDKLIGELSSGMLQRFKLALAFLFSSKMILLDEPTANLDEERIQWFENLITTERRGRTIIIASNLAHEIALCSTKLDVS